jgi:hypothetical protein
MSALSWLGLGPIHNQILALGAGIVQAPQAVAQGPRPKGSGPPSPALPASLAQVPCDTGPRNSQSREVGVRS